MSLFSKFRTTQPSADAPGPPEPTEEAIPTWAMSKEEYDDLRGMLKKTLKNIDVVDHNVRLVLSRLETLQSDMGVSIKNELILGRDQDKLIDNVKGIGYTVDRIERQLKNLNT